MLLAAVVQHDHPVRVLFRQRDILHGIEGIEGVRPETVRQGVGVFVLAHRYDPHAYAVFLDEQRFTGILIVFSVTEGDEPRAPQRGDGIAHALHAVVERVVIAQIRVRKARFCQHGGVARAAL